MDGNRALVVEDDSSISSLFVAALQREGFEADRRSTCRGAESACSEGCYDLIVCDLRLPDGSGGQLLSRLKSLCPNARAIAVTAYFSDDKALGFPLDLVDAVLYKPFDIATLIATVRAAMGMSSNPMCASTERRRHPRFEAEGSVRMATMDERALRILQGDLEQISEGGLLMKAAESLRCGSKLRLAIDVQDVTIEGTGEIVRAQGTIDEGQIAHLMGMQLLSVEPDSHPQLVGYIERLKS